ncbi:hypothetical protein ACFC09_31735 [Streptomyces sp. NPDC056161]|uniref:hypothetical protein n=1 Tax=Streptomyces sp. NPDC056161 TaxID=3345732 RepID=UPI0035D71799
MTNVLSTLRSTGDVPADAETVAADVARGRGALLRRRRRRVAGVAAVAAVAAIAAGSAGQFGGGRSSGPSTAAVQRTPSTAQQKSATAQQKSEAPQQTPDLQFAAYHGPQPAGFTVDTVPAGWKVESSTTSVFVAVPPGTHTPKPVPGATDLSRGIAVMLQGMSRLPADASVTKVTVKGKAGSLGLTEDKGAKWLIYPDSAGHNVLVQTPVELGLTDSQIVRFAEGVTVTGDAEAAAG